ncbi:MAG: hypothetical protein ACTSVW_04915 [Candidatus Njordarchaeales archaeon]
MISNKNYDVENVIVEIKDYINMLKSRGSVLACYYQGSIEEFIPNVSDIDLIVITKNEFDMKKILPKKSNIDLSLYPENIWKKGIYIKPLFRGYIFPIFEKKSYLNNIWNIHNKKLKLIFLSHIIDYSYCTFFSWLNKYAIKILNKENLNLADIKELLKRINGLKYLIMMHNYLVQGYFAKDPYSNFFAKLRQLRACNGVNYEELLKFVEYAYSNILFNTLKGVTDYIKNYTLADTNEDNEKYRCINYISGRNFIIYLPNFFRIFEDPKEWVDVTVKLYKKFKENILILPLELSINLTYYSQIEGGLIKDKIKKHLLNENMTFDISSEYSEVLKEKYYILDKWAKYIKNNKISIGFRPFEYRYANTIKDKGIEFYFYIKHLYQRLILGKIRKVLHEEVLK